MSINIRQVTANATTPVKLGTVPSGPSSVTITNDINVSVLIGVGPSLTNANGFAIPPDASVSFQTYASSVGTDIWVLVATGGTTGQVSILISTTD